MAAYTWLFPTLCHVLLELAEIRDVTAHLH